MKRTAFPIGEVIVEVGGLLYDQVLSPPQDFYTLVIRFHSDRIAILSHHALMETPSWPEDVVEMPHYSVRNDHVCVGSQITNAFVKKMPLLSMGEEKGGGGLTVNCSSS